MKRIFSLFLTVFILLSLALIYSAIKPPSHTKSVIEPSFSDPLLSEAIAAAKNGMSYQEYISSKIAETAETALSSEPPLSTSFRSPTYVASSESLVFHRRSCFYVDNISNSNRVYYYTRQAAINAGKRPCSHCKP